MPAHRVLLALSSEMFKDLDAPVEFLKIHVPDYSKAVVKAFVEYFSSGESVIPSKLIDDFTSLCKEFLIKLPDANVNIDVQTVFGELEQPEEEPQPEQAFKIESAETSTSVFYETLDEVDETMEEEDETEEDYYQDDPNYSEPQQAPRTEVVRRSIIQNPAQPLTRIGAPRTIQLHTENNLYHKKKATQQKIDMAISAIERGLMNTLEAAKKFGIPKSTLYGRVNGYHRPILKSRKKETRKPKKESAD